MLAEGGVAEYAFRAAPVEGEGNIGASTRRAACASTRAAATPVYVPVESADPWGPEIAALRRLASRQGRAPEQGTGEQARLALASRSPPTARWRAGGPEDVAA